jgi:hypothetical protein
MQLIQLLIKVLNLTVFFKSIGEIFMTQRLRPMPLWKGTSEALVCF